MEKPRTGFDEFPRILLSCLRARNSQLHLIDSISSCLDFSAYVSSSSSLLQPLFHHHHGGGGRKRMRHFDGSEDFLYANKRPREEIQWHNTNFGDGFGEFLGYFLDPFWCWPVIGKSLKLVSFLAVVQLICRQTRTEIRWTTIWKWMNLILLPVTDADRIALEAVYTCPFPFETW